MDEMRGTKEMQRDLGLEIAAVLAEWDCGLAVGQLCVRIRCSYNVIQNECLQLRREGIAEWSAFSGWRLTKDGKAWLDRCPRYHASEQAWLAFMSW